MYINQHVREVMNDQFCTTRRGNGPLFSDQFGPTLLHLSLYFLLVSSKYIVAIDIHRHVLLLHLLVYSVICYLFVSM